MNKDVEFLKAFLKGRGLKMTKPRRHVADRLLATGGHLSADQVIGLLRRGGTPVARATVYRTLALLKESGCFDAHDFGRGRKVYEKAVGRPHHDHLFCIGCGDVIEFQEEGIERLQDKVTRLHHFTALYHSHKIFGYCRKCGRQAKRGIIPSRRSHRHD